jgi:hypothetical protein
VAEEVKNDSFEMILNGRPCTLRTDKLLKPPKNQVLLSIGKATLTNKGFLFEGMLAGQRVDFDFPAKSIYSLTCSTKGYLEFYHNNDYFILIPNDGDKSLIKWTLASEEIHNLYDERWRSACADVYDYN